LEYLPQQQAMVRDKYALRALEAKVASLKMSQHQSQFDALWELWKGEMATLYQMFYGLKKPVGIKLNRKVGIIIFNVEGFETPSDLKVKLRLPTIK